MVITVKEVGLEEVEEILPELEPVFSAAYFNGRMYEDFCSDIKESPEVFQTFIAYKKETIVGVAVLETKPHKFIEYYDYPPVHIKRFTVLPKFRSLGIGKKLLDAAKQYAFEKLRLKVIFGESNELGALSFYGREGALYAKDIIETYSHRNTAKQNIEFFKEFLTNKKFRTYRFPEGKGILFVFCNEKEQRTFFENKGFISKEDLLKVA
jgi:GNAT superfamily N-acetyltransferase